MENRDGKQIGCCPGRRAWQKDGGIDYKVREQTFVNHADCGDDFAYILKTKTHKKILTERKL